MCLIFFKQKTASEVRISYWSSDVCSSDLTTRGSSSPPEGRHHCTSAASAARRRRPTAQEQVHHGHDEGPVAAAVALEEVPEQHRSDRLHRKSVAEGKSEDVPLDLGGRRIMKKKKRQQTIHDCRYV